MNRKRKKWWIPILTILVFTVITGCVRTGLSKEAIAKRGLKAKYNEEFIVHEINGSGLDWVATVSPVNRSDLLFKATFLSDGTVESDGYFFAYVKNEIKTVLEKDLKQFYPDSYIRVKEVYMFRKEGDKSDFREKTLEELISEASFETISGNNGCIIEIYINKDIGSSKDYAAEYDYYINTIGEYITEGKMLPITAEYYLVDKESLKRVEEYYTVDLDYDNYFQNSVRGECKRMSACFDTSQRMFVEKDQFIEERKEFEDVK